jgi:2-C-methyl-D-erythritol 4-phosphate cytidylyltransferase
MKSGPQKIAVIMAAGQGLRMGSRMPKQFLHLRGIPVVCHSINLFAGVWQDIGIILVLPPGQKRMEAEIRASLHSPVDLQIVTGGETRFESVRRGLEQVKSPSIVFIHDGARPLVTADLIKRCYDQALHLGSAIPVIPLTESLRRITPGGSKGEDRESFRITQTPQTFRSEILIPAFRQQYQPSFTDEANIVESSGIPIHLIDGEKNNIKVTYPLDLALAEKILEGIAL